MMGRRRSVSGGDIIDDTRDIAQILRDRTGILALLQIAAGTRWYLKSVVVAVREQEWVYILAFNPEICGSRAEEEP